MSLQPKCPMTMPKGFVDSDGTIHKTGLTRPAT